MSSWSITARGDTISNMLTALGAAVQADTSVPKDGSIENAAAVLSAGYPEVAPTGCSYYTAAKGHDAGMRRSQVAVGVAAAGAAVDEAPE